jgi:acyl-CoA thioesterase YciA
MDYKLCYKVIPMPCNTNSHGDIFGGWLLSQMDLAGVVMCKDHNYGRYATISVDKMIFKKPVKVGDILEIYCCIDTIGNSSLTINIRVITFNLENNTKNIVTDAYITIDNISKTLLTSNMENLCIYQTR